MMKSQRRCYGNILLIVYMYLFIYNPSYRIMKCWSTLKKEKKKETTYRNYILNNKQK